jgi:hypothetical protein
METKKDDQRLAEMKMSALDRWNLAFELIELAREISPGKTFPVPLNDSIQWIELKFKNEAVKRGR